MMTEPNLEVMLDRCKINQDLADKYQEIADRYRFQILIELAKRSLQSFDTSTKKGGN